MAVITFWDFIVFYQNFLSPQVKRGMIISNNKTVYAIDRTTYNLRS